ncbi:hypothetical protein CFP56_015113 [Quercus suber]|uniref:Uncharacterized protein n=1 Tax=Quercus suber TaxID=58331 RepID=A0AAW0KR14_QUESU
MRTLKPNTSEQNFGLFNLDLTPVYNAGILQNKLLPVGFYINAESSSVENMIFIPILGEFQSELQLPQMQSLPHQYTDDNQDIDME